MPRQRGRQSGPPPQRHSCIGEIQSAVVWPPLHSTHTRARTRFAGAHFHEGEQRVLATTHCSGISAQGKPVIASRLSRASVSCVTVSIYYRALFFFCFSFDYPRGVFVKLCLWCGFRFARLLLFLGRLARWPRHLGDVR